MDSEDLDIPEESPDIIDTPMGRTEKLTHENQVIIDELVEFVVQCMVKRMFKSQIKRLVYEITGGRVGRNSMERLLSRARSVLVAQATVAKEEEKIETIGFYKMIIADEATTVDEKLKAQEALRQLLGLDARFGNSLDKSIEFARRIRKAQEGMKKATGSTVEGQEAVGPTLTE